jgi:hypothetical protein
MNRSTIPQAPSDRIFAALVYLLPLFEVYTYGIYVFQDIPILRDFYAPFEPMMRVYGSSMGGILVFFLIYLGVVANHQVAHFIRFNALQAILIEVLVFLCGLLIKHLIVPVFQTSMVTQSIVSALFLATFVASVYGIIMSSIGKYAEIPKISETAYLQIDRM